MDGTEGLVRGQPCVDTGAPIMIPVGPECLGRIMNVIGEPIDERGPIETLHKSGIHQEAPEFTDMSVEQEILVTGIKVVDLLAPYCKGGKIGESSDIFYLLENFYKKIVHSVYVSYHRNHVECQSTTPSVIYCECAV